MTHETSLQTALTLLLYHYTVCLRSRKVSRKKLNIIQNVYNSTLPGMAFQLVEKDLEAFTKYCLGALLLPLL